ncbi:MAG: hypothetical protein VW715_09830 [Rhodospirillales bacterium]|jgi:hypothetical protein
MRCKACNSGPLSDIELSRKDHKTGEHIDLCNTCYTISNRAIIAQEYESLYLDEVQIDELEFELFN